MPICASLFALALLLTAVAVAARADDLLYISSDGDDPALSRNAGGYMLASSSPVARYLGSSCDSYAEAGFHPLFDARGAARGWCQETRSRTWGRG